MKKQGVFVLGIMVILSTWASPMPAAEFNGPKIVIAAPEFDFKTVKEGEVVAHTFKVFNQGNQELRILSVKPG
ncbi:MAG: hypothetical protein R6U38_13370 [Desulfatiglandaceae bacterium]